MSGDEEDDCYSSDREAESLDGLENEDSEPPVRVPSKAPLSKVFNDLSFFVFFCLFVLVIDECMIIDDLS